MNSASLNRTGIRIVELPAARMASSLGHDLDEFDAWWSALDKARSDKFYPRDFMYFDKKMNDLVWLYALPATDIDTGGFQLVDFKGGLFAVAVSIDRDDVDGERVYGEIQAWIKESGCFSLDETEDRLSLFHVITSDEAASKMGYRQLDIYVPIR